MKVKDILKEAGSFSYGYKQPKKGSVKAEIETKRKSTKDSDVKINDEMVGNAKVKKQLKEETRYGVIGDAPTPERLLYYIATSFHNTLVSKGTLSPKSLKSIIWTNYEKFGDIDTVLKNLSLLENEGWISITGNPQDPENIQINAEQMLYDSIRAEMKRNQPQADWHAKNPNSPLD